MEGCLFSRPSPALIICRLFDDGHSDWCDVIPQCSFFCFVLFFVLAQLGLRCCAQAFSSCSERGLLFIAVRGLLIAVASPVAEHGL